MTANNIIISGAYLSRMSTNRLGLQTEAIFSARCMHSSTLSQSLYLSTAVSGAPSDSLLLAEGRVAALAASRGGQNRCEHRLTMRHWSGFFSNYMVIIVYQMMIVHSKVKHQSSMENLVGVLSHLGDESLVVLFREVSAAQQCAHGLGQHLNLMIAQRKKERKRKGKKIHDITRQ